MPYVEVKNAGRLTKQQTSQIIEEITNIISKITGKSKDATYVVVQEIPRSNWGVGGILLEEKDK